MEIKIQVYSRKGFYGPEIVKRVRNVAAISGALVDAFDELPDKLEGELAIDWTEIDVKIVRKWRTPGQSISTVGRAAKSKYVLRKSGVARQIDFVV